MKRTRHFTHKKQKAVVINTLVAIFTSESESPLAYKWTNLFGADGTTRNNRIISCRGGGRHTDS